MAATHVIVRIAGPAIGGDESGAVGDGPTLTASKAGDGVATLDRLAGDLAPQPRCATENQDVDEFPPTAPECDSVTLDARLECV